MKQTASWPQLTLVSLVTALICCDAAAEWQTIAIDETMQLERYVHNKSTHELRITTAINAPMAELIALLNDVKRYPEFLPHFRWVEIMAQQDQLSYVYFLIDPPVIRRRDYTLVISNHYSDDGNLFERRFQQANDHGPEPVDGIVRLQLVEGSWQLTRVDDNKTRVVHWVKTDPAGPLPKWLANWANRRGLEQIVAALRQRATTE